MENKIEFNWELYQSGLYDVVTRYGRKVEQLHTFDCDSSHNLYGLIDGETLARNWYNNGHYWRDKGESEFDLFLIPKEKEDHSPDIGKMVIPELKGVLMEVSHYEDFKTSSNLEVFGINSGNFLTHIGSYQYARPIKEVKEAWVNVYENDEGEIYINPTCFTSKNNAMSVINSKKYIKTIKITNEKDGE